MYISKVTIQGYRNFKNIEILLNEGVNVIIGHNNAGKSNLLRALSLVIDPQAIRKLSIYDFYQNIPLCELQETPPSVTISLNIEQSKGEFEGEDDLATVRTFLTKLEAPYEAKLTYKFFLPEDKIEEYQKTLSDLNGSDENEKRRNAWAIIKRDFLRYYVSKIWGGDPNLQYQANIDDLRKFDFQFLDAIRDVERDMLTGRNTLLREVIDFFLDYGIKHNPDKTREQKIDEIKRNCDDFQNICQPVLDILHSRISEGKKEILEYANETGASFNNAEPNFNGNITESDLYAALSLIIQYKEKGFSIPASHNGLGYNNLIFISLLLSKMQIDSDGNYLGSNAKVFPILAIEEPEAHLHPSMQYKFLSFLQKNLKEKKKTRQIFITTHSTQIASAVNIEQIICLHNDGENTKIGYPAKVFDPCEGEDDTKLKVSKAYVQRFLDATKSDMLFAQKIIFVEGIAEELLIPTFAKYLGYSLEDHHVAIINVGGRYYEHFLRLFDSSTKYAIPKRIACLTDRDPVRKKIEGEIKYKKCYPYEFGLETEIYDYKEHAKLYIEKYNLDEDNNIHFFSQDERTGKTLEYDIILFNHRLKLLLTESISNKDELLQIMDAKDLNEALRILRRSDENDRIINSIEKSSWDNEDKLKALIASRYLNSIVKGNNALELVKVLEENMENENCCEYFKVPKYIKDAIEWLCK
jgi:putative ATP-dependent endonuclease of OLD family